MKHETGGVAVKEFVGLKTRMYLFLVDDSDEHKYAKSVNKNVVEKTTHDEYKSAFQSKKFEPFDKQNSK